MIIIKDYNYWKIFGYIILIELLGFLSGLAVGHSNMSELSEISNITPPSFVFGIVWTILYACIGFIAYLVYGKAPSNVKTAFTFHLLLNFAWPYIFFNMQAYPIAFFAILLMICTLLYIRVWIKDVDKLANILCIIYLIWLIYACFLNFMVIIA